MEIKKIALYSYSFFRRKHEIIETTWKSDFVGHRRPCQMHCKSTKKVGCFFAGIHELKKGKAKEGYVQVFMMLRTASILLGLLWVFLISFQFSDDNTVLDIKLWDYGFYFYSAVAFIIFNNTSMIKEYINAETYLYVCFWLLSI